MTEIGSRRDYIETDVLGVVSKYGGETIIAGPRMQAMQAELADLMEEHVIRIHYGDPDDRARSYNQGYDDGYRDSSIGSIHVPRLVRALTRYADGRKRLILPMARVVEIANGISAAYEQEL